MWTALAKTGTKDTAHHNNQNTKPEAETQGFAKCQLTNMDEWLFFLKLSDATCCGSASGSFSKNFTFSSWNKEDGRKDSLNGNK